MKYDLAIPIPFTPLKTNTSPEKWWLEDVFPIEIVHFLGDMLIFRGATRSITWKVAALASWKVDVQKT